MKYSHVQSVASTTWTVNHNLGRKPIFDVFVYNSGDLVKIIPQFIEYTDDNTIIITFSQNRTGIVNCVTSYTSNPDQTPTIPPSGDPYWANVMSLLHFNGINGSTTFTDEKGLTWTGVSGASLTTTDPKFGSSSLSLLSTSRQYINNSNPIPWDIAAGQDFTFEVFTNFSTTGTSSVFSRTNSVTAPNGWILIRDGGYLQWLYGSANIFSATPTSSGVWYHLAVTRHSGTHRLFLDGNLIGSTSYDDSAKVYSVGMSIGCEKPSTPWSTGNLVYNGKIDEFRFTKGVARYTSNFTPPVAEFLNS